MASILLYAWLTWCSVCVMLFLLGALIVRPDYPQFNGFMVHVPLSWAQRLTHDELQAVVLHELGHKYHLHVWKNLGRMFFFLQMSAERRREQELEADDYVGDQHELHLASALRKMSNNPFDLWRASRLELRHGSAHQGDPSRGMRV